MNKKLLSERDICTRFITPTVRKVGWDELTQLREEVSFTRGRTIVRGKLVTRGKAKRADYVLYYKPDIPIAIIEAKYQDEGVISLDDPRVLQIPPFDTMGTPIQLIRNFGTRADFERAVHELQAALYKEDKEVA